MESGPYDSGTTYWRRSGRLALFPPLNIWTAVFLIEFPSVFTLFYCVVIYTTLVYCISVTSINFSLFFSLVFNIFLKRHCSLCWKCAIWSLKKTKDKCYTFSFSECTESNYVWMMEILVYLAWCPLTTAKKSMPFTRVKQETNIQLRIKIKAEIKISANTLPNLYSATHTTSTFGQLHVISHSHYI